MEKRVVKLNESQIRQLASVIAESCGISVSDSADDSTNRGSTIEVNPASDDGKIATEFNTTGDDLAKIGVGNDRYRSAVVGKLGLTLK